MMGIWPALMPEEKRPSLPMKPSSGGKPSMERAQRTTVQPRTGCVLQRPLRSSMSSASEVEPSVFRFSRAPNTAKTPTVMMP